MVNNVIRVVNYVIAARPSLLNFMIADMPAAGTTRLFNKSLAVPNGVSSRVSPCG